MKIIVAITAAAFVLAVPASAAPLGPSDCPTTCSKPAKVGGWKTQSVKPNGLGGKTNRMKVKVKINKN